MMGVGITRQFDAGQPLSSAGSVWQRKPLGLSRRLGLSARLFLIIIAFVGLAEILIYVPAVTTYRRSWLSDRLTAARVAALVADAVPEQIVGGDLTERLLAGAGARAITLSDGRRSRVIAPDASVEEPAETIDLRRSDWLGALSSAWQTRSIPAGAPVRVIGPGLERNETIEILIDEAPLREALIAFSLQLLLASLIVTTAAAILVFVVLQRAFVLPMRRLARNIAAFAHEPENAQRVITPSGRRDEIGDAEIALAGMEIALAGELRHKRRLAGLGLSVSKINHELRNLLTTAQLLGDRLEKVEDPVVQRVAPRLVATLDRANRFCEATLAYGKAAERHPRRRMVPLAPILADLPDLAALSRGAGPHVHIEMAPDLTVDVDGEQLSRVLTNLVRNAVQALDAAVPRGEPARIVIAAAREGRAGAGGVTILVSDNGPGLPERAREHLFAPFQGSVRAGGTGLGLAVAAELTELNGGTLTLDPSETGACFRLVIPDRPAETIRAA